MTAFEHAAAGRVIARAILSAPTSTLRTILCAAVGHPPIVNNCVGELTCGRCGQITGDLLTRGVAHPERLACIGHDCETCRRVVAELTENDKLLLPLAAVAFVEHVSRAEASVV